MPSNIPGFLDFFGVATPVTVDGVQQVADGVPQFGAAGHYSLLSVASALAWGLGYFGMPQVLLRFMAIRSEHELTHSRRIATVWVVISLSVAVFIGLVGRALFPDALLTTSSERRTCSSCWPPTCCPRCWRAWSWRASWRPPSAPPTPIC